ncbi:sulfurtransferase [Rhodoferax sp. PAMC 29310]|uniref:sulfurtransferase n=1 Tax=Rhodoferax sp. PAMC 29310 TaxID=2822760 RepID=UPI001B337811|nr:sulfurtransferase [Rhodoferax sp. PAMC 29310]
MYTTLISAHQLQTLFGSAQPPMVFDCSFELMQAGAGDLQYLQAHIPGAVRADLDRHLSAAKSASDAASGGRHPLPSRATFAAWLDHIGLTPALQVVVYDRQGVNYCGRLWWMLKWMGHDKVAVLDGGLQAWQALGGPTDSATELDLTAIKFNENMPLAPENTALATTNTIAVNLQKSTQTLIDARGAPRYRGEVEPLDPVAGHIPGALNRPFSLNFNADGTFKSASDLRAEFETLLDGRDPATVVHHCGSGVSAVPNIIAMEVAGLGKTALYAGSWSEWCSDPSRPVAKG